MCCQRQLLSFTGWLVVAGAVVQRLTWEDDSTVFIQNTAITNELVVAPSQTEAVATEWRGKLRIRSNAKCLDMDTSGSTNLHMSDCHSGSNQMFEMHDDKHIITLYDNRCTDMDTGNQNLYIGDCHSGTNQKFYFDGELLKNEWYSDSKCADDSGSNVYMADCHSGDNQKFYVEYFPTPAPTPTGENIPPTSAPTPWPTLVPATVWRGKVRLRSNDQCVDMATDDGRNLYMGTCHGGMNQIFELHDDKHIITLWDDRCVDYDPGNGNLYVGDCHTGANQKFYFDGEHLKSEYDDKCGDDGNNNIYMGSCHTGDNQKFWIEPMPSYAPTPYPTPDPTPDPTPAPTPVPTEETLQNSGSVSSSASASSSAPVSSGYDVASNIASAAGDPHMTNLLGERFDLNSEGLHTLLQIPRGSGAQLEVVGSVERLPTEKLGESPCDQFFFKKFTVRGTWLGMHDGEVIIDAGKGGELEGFGATRRHGGETTWMSYDSLIKTGEPATSGDVQMWGCNVKDSAEQRRLCKELGSLAGGGNRQLRVFTRRPNTLMMTLQGSGAMPLHLAFSRFEVASPAYLNLGLIGISRSDDAGGLLGSDDHSEVNRPAPGCKKTHHAKIRPPGNHPNRTKSLNRVRLNNSASRKVNHSLAREMRLRLQIHSDSTENIQTKVNHSLAREMHHAASRGYRKVNHSLNHVQAYQKHHPTNLHARVNHSLNHILAYRKRKSATASNRTTDDNTEKELTAIASFQNVDADLDDEFPILGSVMDRD